MTYNKTAIYKYKETHLDEYRQMTQKATAKWREKNREVDNLKANRRMKIYHEWKRLRNIELF
jgi:hypothetical protein